MLDNGSLRISNVSKSDAGMYTCVARNQFGVASSAGSLLVKGKKLFPMSKHTNSVYVPPNKYFINEFVSFCLLNLFVFVFSSVFSI